MKIFFPNISDQHFKEVLLGVTMHLHQVKIIDKPIVGHYIIVRFVNQWGFDIPLGYLSENNMSIKGVPGRKFIIGKTL